MLSLSYYYFWVIIISTSFNISTDGSDDKQNIVQQETFELSNDYKCSSKNVLIDPNVLIQQDSDIEWFFDDNISTHIQAEVCLHDGELCGKIYTKNNSTFKTLCKQRYIAIELLAISLRDNLKVKKLYTIPASCECTMYRKISRKT